MSLTRLEWEEMWQAVKKIERELMIMEPQSIVTSRQFILHKLNIIKAKIQLVIGQME